MKPYQIYFSLLIFLFLTACKSSAPKIQTVEKMEAKEETAEQAIEETPVEFEIVKTEEAWKAELSKMEFHVLREKGTERAFTGDLLENKDEGTYTCRGCANDLFDSATKFKSGTGWPSFYQPIAEEKLALDVDYHIGYERTEVMCGRCGGHLGHVFKDGPKPTGLRYCINAVSLDFEKKK